MLLLARFHKVTEYGEYFMKVNVDRIPFFVSILLTLTRMVDTVPLVNRTLEDLPPSPAPKPDPITLKVAMDMVIFVTAGFVLLALMKCLCDSGRWSNLGCRP